MAIAIEDARSKLDRARARMRAAKTSAWKRIWQKYYMKLHANVARATRDKLSTVRERAERTQRQRMEAASRMIASEITRNALMWAEHDGEKGMEGVASAALEDLKDNAARLLSVRAWLAKDIRNG